LHGGGRAARGRHSSDVSSLDGLHDARRLGQHELLGTGAVARRRRVDALPARHLSKPAMPTINPYTGCKKGKGSPYSIAKRRAPELIPVLGSQPAGNVSHKPGGRLPLLSARPAVTLATLDKAATNFAAW